MNSYSADVIIAGAGISGLVCAYELLKKGKTVLIFDKDKEKNLGGLAKLAFGGVFLVDTPDQKRLGIKDSPELGLKDWLKAAQFREDEVWQQKWAEYYCYNTHLISDFYAEVGLSFVTVLFTERGLYRPRMTVPRFHVTWGTGYELVNKTVEAIDKLPQRSNLKILFEHEVNDVQQVANQGILRGKNIATGAVFEASAGNVIIASGGIGGGDLSEIKKHWPGEGLPAPIKLLSGAHKYGDGLLHHKVENIGGVLSNLQDNWLYPAGVHRKDSKLPIGGLSLLPGPGVLWFNALGERIGPQPLIAALNTPWLVKQILQQPGQYTWLVLNWKIAIKELLVSLSKYFEAIRAKDESLLIRSARFGDERRIRLLMEEAPDDVLVANNIESLMDMIQDKSLYDFKINRDKFIGDIKEYDDLISRGKAYYNDEQLRQIMIIRSYLPNSFSTSEFKRILDPKNGPLLAIRTFPITRKSMGGIQTDLDCRILQRDGTPFGNLYAIGECAGYGGGGMHGRGVSEGSWLGGCIVTARTCAKTIA